MKVSIIINYLAGNGTENVCVTIANKLYQYGYDVEIITLDPKECDVKKSLINGIKVICFNCGIKKSLMRIPIYLKKSKPNIVFSFYPLVNLSVLIAKHFLHLKFIYISRCNNTLSVKNKILLNNEKSKLIYIKKLIVFKLLELLYKYSDMIVAQCDGMRKDLIDNYGVKPEKCVTIYNPVRETFAFNHNLKSKDNYILCVGRLHLQKAFDVAIRCFSKISCKYPDLKLFIAGKGDLEDYLKKLALNLNIHNKVNFIGYTENIQSLYENAKFTLLTSVVEGFPNVLLESIAVGTPVVAFDCPSGPSEIIQEGVNGFLVRNKDENALVSSMDKALTFNWDREAVHASSLKYSINNIIPKYICLFDDLLKGNNSN